MNKMKSFSTYIHLDCKNIKMSLSPNLITTIKMLIVEKNIEVDKLRRRRQKLVDEKKEVMRVEGDK